MQRLHGLKARMLSAPDQQISLTDPDARSMATSGRGFLASIVGLQRPDRRRGQPSSDRHACEVTNDGTDRSQQLSHVANDEFQDGAGRTGEQLDAVDRPRLRRFNSEEITWHARWPASRLRCQSP